MLDKSVPYVKLFMKRTPSARMRSYDLPDGYSFAYFKPGDESDWGAIEYSVGEFETADEGKRRFEKDFLQYLDEVKRRTLFIENSKGDKIATATAWWDYTGKKRHPLLHWVAVHPEHQGKGLGKALIARIVEEMVHIEGQQDFYLSTQTWSHKAIKLYEWVGFSITTEPKIGKRNNDTFEEAIRVLQQIEK